jgi:NADPH:quinone reductase-like Zn-dependent oxidoreductase
MRNVAICGSQVQRATPTGQSAIQTISLEGVTVRCGLIETPDIQFDRFSPETSNQVLVKIRAFSCNYRDKALILKMATNGPAHTFYVVGSEFMGEVVDVGSTVTDFEKGDRVIGNGSYPSSGVEGVPPGIPTNHGSKEYQLFHPAKLIKIPPEMPDEVAAAFPIGAQTTYSMIRRLNLAENANVLVTAAKSNTSLFAINALRRYGFNVYATSTSARFEAKLKELGLKQLIVVDPDLPNFAEHPTLRTLAQELGGFDAVIDPFFDIHLGKVIGVMGVGSRYITCGFYDQYSQLVGQSFQPQWNGRHIMTAVMLGNLQIIGNCIGQTEDLREAIADYAAGKLPVVIDSVFSGYDQVGAFFERTYNSPKRFGKVVFKYEA